MRKQLVKTLCVAERVECCDLEQALFFLVQRISFISPRFLLLLDPGIVLHLFIQLVVDLPED
jgi:hypothetical protein